MYQAITASLKSNSPPAEPLPGYVRMSSRNELELFMMIITRYPYLQSTIHTVEIGNHLTDFSAGAVSHIIRHISVLSLNNSSLITDQGFYTLTRLTSNLRQITLRGLNITRASLHALNKFCPRIETIALEYCTQLTPDSLDALIDLRLTSISLKFKGRHPQDFGKNTTTADHLTRYPDLTRLTVHSASDTFFDYLFNLRRFPETTFWTGLTTLQLHLITTVPETTIANFILLHRNIQQLEIDFAQITDTTLDMIGNSLNQLEHVSFNSNRGITSAGLRRFIINCPTLLSCSAFNCEIRRSAFLNEVRTPDGQYLINPGGSNLGRLDQHALESIRNYNQQHQQQQQEHIDDDDDQVSDDDDDDDDQISDDEDEDMTDDEDDNCTNDDDDD